MSKWKFFCGMAWRATRNYGDTQPFVADHSGFWFRVLGCGLHVSTMKRKNALFSERYGYTKALYLFGLRFSVLTP